MSRGFGLQKEASSAEMRIPGSKRKPPANWREVFSEGNLASSGA